MRVRVSVVRLVISFLIAVMNYALSIVSISSVSPVWYSEANRVSIAYSRIISVSVGSVFWEDGGRRVVSIHDMPDLCRD
jgi:hypothetical protein